MLMFQCLTDNDLQKIITFEKVVCEFTYTCNSHHHWTRGRAMLRRKTDSRCLRGNQCDGISIPAIVLEPTQKQLAHSPRCREYTEATVLRTIAQNLIISIQYLLPTSFRPISQLDANPKTQLKLGLKTEEPYVSSCRRKSDIFVIKNIFEEKLLPHDK